jgi:hypothetical protein
MPIIDWNRVGVDLEPSVAAGHFIRLLLAAEKKETPRAIAFLDTLNRTAIQELTGEIPASVITSMKPLEIIDCLKLLGEKVNGLSRSHDKKVPFRSGRGDMYSWVEWEGYKTPGRSVKIMCSNVSSQATLFICTGTGKPSHFLEPLCQLVINRALEELTEATKYYSR